MVVANAARPKVIPVGDRRIGPGEDIFIIAEIGINHNQDLELAYGLIDAAAEGGCDAAKFQTFRAADLYTTPERAGTYRLMGRDLPIFKLLEGLEMPQDWIPKLQERCRQRGILFFSTPVAPLSTDWLDAAGVPCFKISSYDYTNLPLVSYVGKKKKPVIFSVGAASMAEVDETARCLDATGAPYAIMHCITKYPAPFRCANLAVMDTLRLAYGVPVGFSDNGFADEDGRIDGIRVPLAAAQAGADLFEIHTTLDRKLPGADHGFAALPDELKEMTRAMREARHQYNDGKRFDIDPEIWGVSMKRTLPEEEYVRNFGYKCLFARKAVKRGERLTADNVAILRPGQDRRGLEPKYYDLLTSKAKASHDIRAWEPINWDEIL